MKHFIKGMFEMLEAPTMWLLILIIFGVAFIANLDNKKDASVDNTDITCIYCNHLHK